MKRFRSLVGPIAALALVGGAALLANPAHSGSGAPPERLDFQPTEAFASLGIEPESEAIALEVAHSGHDAPFRLGLVRSGGKQAWRVDRETVERRFPYRSVTRAEAAQLTDPQRRK